MKIKSKFFEVYIESLGLELPEYQPRQNQDDSRECFIPACLDAAYKIVVKNTNKVMMAFTVKIDGRKAIQTARFVRPNSTVTLIGFDVGRKVEGNKVIEEVREFVFGRPQVQNGAPNNNAITQSSGTIEIIAHPTSFLREEVREVETSTFEIADVAVRSLNELTMKHFRDGEKVATKAGTKKEVRSFSLDKGSRQTFSIYDVDYRTKFVQVTFKYRDLYSLLQKNIVPAQELKEMLANNSPQLTLFKDHYDIADKKKLIQELAHAKATRRLLKDLRELQMNPLPTIAASPLDDNLLLWHANLHGTKGSPFEGLIFHLELQFDEDYPFEPPRVQMLNFLAHSNVIHGFICLDMLVSGDFVADQNRAYTGWSSAYSLLSVLLQLQAFLFDRANMTEESIAAAKFHQSRFSCSCGHCQTRPWPVHNNQESLSESERILKIDATVIVPVKKSEPSLPKSRVPSNRTKRITGSAAKVTLSNVIAKPSRFMKAIRCNPKAIILPILAAAALPNIYKHAWKYSASMEINSAMLKGVEKLTQIKTETLQSLPSISAMSFSITPNMVFMLKIFGVIICIGLVQWLFIAASAKNQTKRIRDEETKLNRVQADLKMKQKAEKERKLAKQLRKAKINRAKEFDEKMRLNTSYFPTHFEFVDDPPVISKKLLGNNSYIVHEEDEFFESPAKIKKDQRREAKIKAVLNARTAVVKPSEVPKNRNTGVNGAQAGPGRSLKKSKFARNSNSINRNRGSETAPLESQSYNRYRVHDESTEDSFMEKQLLLMNHSLIDMMRSKNNNTNSNSATVPKKSGPIFPMLPNEILLEIFSYLNHSDIMSIARVCTPFRILAFDGFLWDRRELICFHSKVTFEEDVLGVGLNVEYYPDSDRLSAITSPLDLLSYHAFKRDKVRTSVWKTKFKFFMPLYINRMHGQKAIPLVNESLAELLNRPFEPLMALEVFPKLMNTMVVELMDRKLHASMKALEGFCFFHRLLLEYTLRYPEVLQKVESTIKKFINNRSARTKKSVPNLGEFLSLLTVSQKYGWEDVCDIYIEEQLIRNVKWVVQALPNWNKNFDTLSKDNASTQFLHATQVSQRLLIFNYYFLKDVAKPRISRGDVNYVKQNYDLHYGKPSLTIRNEFHHAVKYIQKLDISKWNVFFHHLGLGAPSNNTIYQWLAQARKISALRKYHK